MINDALVFIRNNLDSHLKNQYGLDETVVVLNHLLEQDGSVPQKNQNKMVVTLINLDAENCKQFYGGESRQGNVVARINPAARFNLMVLFTAVFDDYVESLKFLNSTILYFQANCFLNSQTCPDIPRGIEKLQFEVENINFLQTQNLWNSMGVKYLPSVIYRVRHVTLQAGQIETVADLVQQTDTRVLSL
ncbi:MAG TPA: DUF4255 domain-containing protein [Candidatus Acidoferrum sp.]|nr:DUF4255 domain-containing protein [Candidatus Acidoferrum sp.]